MYSAKIKISWITKDIKGKDAAAIVRGIENVQNLSCLTRMGRAHGTASDQEHLRKLDAFLTKYEKGRLTIDDIRGLDIPLSIGHIKCIECVEIPDEG